MKSCYARGVVLALGMCWVAGTAQAEQAYSTPSLLPQAVYSQGAPLSQQAYPATHTPVGYFDRFDAPADQPPSPPPASAPDAAPTEQASPYAGDMVGQSWGCGTPTVQESCGESCCTCNGCWYGGLYGLIMTRDRENFSQLSFDTTDPVGQLLSTHTGTMGWNGGFEVRVGRYLCGGEYALEGSYWGIYSSGTSTTVLDSQIPGNINTVFDMTTIVQSTNPGTTINDFYDGAQAHRLNRDWEFQNLELNLIHLGLRGNNACGPASTCFQWFGGLRFFKFDENFSYQTSQNNPVFGADDTGEYYYDIDVSNQLFGFQVGARADYNMTNNLRFHLSPKLGIYENFIEHQSRIFNNYSVAVVGVGNPLAGEEFDVESSLHDFSMLAELDLGVDYRITRCLSVTAGYRAIAVTGVALSTNQIPANFADIPGVADIDSNASLILHGVYIGGEYNW